MFQPVVLPLWLFVLIVLFAAVTFASHFLFPSVRWFFRKRMEWVVARLNRRLRRPIEPFKLAQRHDMIESLVHDPQVSAAIHAHARRVREPDAVAFQTARKYAREIVPAFSATVYFGFGTRIARWLSRSLYSVRIGGQPDALEGIAPDAAVVFVMNHRSNMDYVLVTHLVSGASALSYAVGEWARVWPMSWLVRAMGAYFIQRGGRGALYRAVLQRYVQRATEGGVTQAVFPEGGLSLDGRVGAAKLGILSYIIEGRALAERDVVFIPVALNYDRVIEDRILTRAASTGDRRFSPPLGEVLGALLRHFLQRLTLRFRGFGTATVSFGAPLSLDELAASHGDLSRGAIARQLMERIAAVVPVLPVPLVSWLLLRDGPSGAEHLVARIAAITGTLGAAGISVPRRAPEVQLRDALDMLSRRGLVVKDAAGLWSVSDAGGPLLDYYAASIAHHLDAREDQIALAGQ